MKKNVKNVFTRTDLKMMTLGVLTAQIADGNQNQIENMKFEED